MKAASRTLLVKGTVVTFNYAGVKRTGVFMKWSQVHTEKALVCWQKEGETKPSNHEVAWQALHSKITDANDLRLDNAEKAEKAMKAAAKAQARADKKAEKVAVKTVKKSVKTVKKAEKVIASVKPVCAQAEALRKLADAIQYCCDNGIDPHTLGL